MQVITTTHYAASTTKPSRIKAQCDAGTLTISVPTCEPYNRIEEVHSKACSMLMRDLTKKYGSQWSNKRIGGWFESWKKPGHKMVWVSVPATQHEKDITDYAL